MVGCTFAGHRTVLSGGMDKRIHKALASILEKHRDICFYCGGMGEFDILCAREAYKFKRGNPDRNILIYLILPYMMQKIQSGKGTSFELYDEIIIPGDIDALHYKQAIPQRNRWMVDHSQYLIAHVFRHGGAWNTIKYAKKKNLTIYNLI